MFVPSDQTVDIVLQIDSVLKINRKDDEQQSDRDRCKAHRHFRDRMDQFDRDTDQKFDERNGNKKDAHFPDHAHDIVLKRRIAFGKPCFSLHGPDDEHGIAEHHGHERKRQDP